MRVTVSRRDAALTRDGGRAPTRSSTSESTARTSKPTSRRSRENVTSDASGLHVGAGLRRELAHGSIGARVELDDLDGDLLLAVRAFDYRRHLSRAVRR